MDQIVNFFFKTRSGRLALAAIVALIGAYAARVALVDVPAQQAKDAAAVGSATLEAMDEKLADLSDEAVPVFTRWYPAEVPCGSSATLGPEREDIWTKLGLPAEGETEFQYRLSKKNGVVTVHARRDSDCDGFYAIWTLESKAGGALGGGITAQNILE